MQKRWLSMASVLTAIALVAAACGICQVAGALCALEYNETRRIQEGHGGVTASYPNGVLSTPRECLKCWHGSILCIPTICIFLCHLR